MKAAERWNYPVIFVAVDCQNKNAIAMYQKLQFSILLDESLLIRRVSTKLAPRLFMARSLLQDSTASIDDALKALIAQSTGTESLPNNESDILSQMEGIGNDNTTNS